ncbi:MAG TPA: ORF6N domain-containing protein [Solirubrobacterales bacterium]|nr:ORF6N domain-containing protein [Solirubrobacterales bacterium]
MGERAEVQVVVGPTIEKRIFVVRDRQVMLDEDLADLYGVETRVLVQQVKAMLWRAAQRPGVAVNIEIMRAFVELRRVASSFQELQERLDQMEMDIGARLGEHDEQLRQIFEALRQLIAPPPSTKRPIGFRVREGDG